MTAQNQTPAPPTIAWPTMPLLSPQSCEDFVKNHANWLDNIGKLQTETLLFLGGRFERDVELFKKFGACRKPEDFFSLQSDFAHRLFAEYSDEGGRLLSLFTDGMRSAASGEEPVATGKSRK